MATIVTRAGKGSPLTNTEVDANFTNLNTDKAELSGATFTGEITANAGIALPDSQKATFGASDDLQIFHDGSNSYIQDQGLSGTGNLILAGADVEIATFGGNKYFLGSSNVAQLYHTNNAKLATTATGIDVTGEITADALTINSSGVQIGTVLQSTSTTSARLALMDANTTAASQVGIGATGNTLGLYAGGGLPRVVVSGTGIDVSGSVVADGLTVDGAVDINTNNVTQTALTPSYNFIESDVTDQNTQFLQASGSFRIRTVDDSGSNVAERMRIDHGTGDVSFYEDTGSTAKMVWDASAEMLTTSGLTVEGSGIGQTFQVIDTSEDTALFASSGNTSGKNTELVLRARASNSWVSSGLRTNTDSLDFYAGEATGATLSGGTKRMTIDSTGIDVTGTATSTQVILGNGSVSAPSLTFGSDTDTGINRGGTNNIAFVAGGATRLYIDANTSLATVSAGTSNLTLGVNAGNSIVSGGSYNVVVGDAAGTAITTGDKNVAVGFASAINTTTASNNTAVGYYSLYANTTGTLNTAVGAEALSTNTTSSNNTAMGYRALRVSTGGSNTAVGTGSLESNTTASNNTAVGHGALNDNTTGNDNTATGHEALASNTTGTQNTAFGRASMDSNTEGHYNSSLGYTALQKNTTGDNNTGLGHGSLRYNTAGAGNTAVGTGSLGVNTTASQNTAVGRSALGANTTAADNTAVGYHALRFTTTATNNTAVGAGALRSTVTGASNTAVGTASQYASTGASNTSVGMNSMRYNTTGGANVAVGKDALKSNTTASNNTAVGYQSQEATTTGANNSSFGLHALRLNTTATANVAVGTYAGYSLTTGGSNTAIGYNSLSSEDAHGGNVAVGTNTLAAQNAGATGYNTAVGHNAGLSVTTGTNNTILGGLSGDSLTTGGANTALGMQALNTEAAGGNSVAVGYQALYGANGTGARYNTAVGSNAGQNVTNGTQNTLLGGLTGNTQTSGSQNTLLGYATQASSNDGVRQIVIGSNTTGAGNNTVKIGTVSASATLSLDGSDTSWAAASDERLKKDIVNSTVGLSFINALRPVTFKWNAKNAIANTLPQYDADSTDPVYGEGKAHHGFIAQEIKAVIDANADVVNGHNLWHTDPDGTQQVAPSALVPMLVKAIQELTARIETLEG